MVILNIIWLTKLASQACAKLLIKTKSKTSQSCLERYVEETFVEKKKNVHLINQENR